MMGMMGMQGMMGMEGMMGMMGMMGDKESPEPTIAPSVDPTSAPNLCLPVKKGMMGMMGMSGMEGMMSKARFGASNGDDKPMRMMRKRMMKKKHDGDERSLEETDSEPVPFGDANF
jgi:hypothetical protein